MKNTLKNFVKNDKLVILVEHGEVKEILVSSDIFTELSVTVVDQDYRNLSQGRAVYEPPRHVLNSDVLHRRFPIADPFGKLIKKLLHQFWGIAHNGDKPVDLYSGGKFVRTYRNIKEVSELFNLDRKKINRLFKAPIERDGFSLEYAKTKL